MATTPTPKIITWKYNDWRRQPTRAEQLARLILHIEEVEGFVLESGSKGSTLKLQETYRNALQEQIDKLERQILLSQAGARIGQVSSFARGTGP